MKKTLALVGLLAIAGLGVGVLTGCHKDEPVDPDPGTVDNDGPEELEHDWVETSSVPATCLEAGSETYTCSVCGETETLTVPALGHKWSEAVYDQSESKWVRTCERCEAVEELELDKLPDDAVLAPTNETELDSLLSVNGATIAIGAEYDEDGDEVVPFEVSSAVAVGENVSITLELGEDAVLQGTDSNAGTSSQTGTSHPGLITVAKGGSLTISADDSSSIIQTSASHAVVNVSEGGTCVIEGGHYEVTSSSAYTIVNDGDLTINGGTFSTTNAGSSLVINGDDHVSGPSTGTDHVHSLTITGGDFLGGKHVVKNCLGGDLTIEGGNFDGFIQDETLELGTSDDIIDNEEGKTVINGGVFGDSLEDTEDAHGAYNHTFAVKAGVVGEGETVAKESSITINGGTIYPGDGTDNSATNCGATGGCSGYFSFGDIRDSKQEPATMADQVIITSESVWASMSEAITADSNIHVEGESLPYTLVAASAWTAAQQSSGSTGGDQ